MKRSEKENERVKECRCILGSLIKNIRTLDGLGSISLRKLAEAAEIPPSNMKYIEDGVNAPSPEVYLKIIQYLHPTNEQLAELDHAYSLVRGTPPPDVCSIMGKNEKMNDVIRLIDNDGLNDEQIEKVKALFISFQKSSKGVMKNGWK